MSDSHFLGRNGSLMQILPEQAATKEVPMLGCNNLDLDNMTANELCEDISSFSRQTLGRVAGNKGNDLKSFF